MNSFLINKFLFFQGNQILFYFVEEYNVKTKSMNGQYCTLLDQ